MLVEPSTPSADALCPHCGTLLWFLKSATGVQMYSNEDMLRIRSEILKAFNENIGIPPRYESLTSLFDAVALDSLDLVDIMMEIEEEESLHIPVLRGLPLGEIIGMLLEQCSEGCMFCCINELLRVASFGPFVVPLPTTTRPEAEKRTRRRACGAGGRRPAQAASASAATRSPNAARTPR